MSDTKDVATIRAEIAFGFDVEAFMKTDIGRYLTARANDEIEKALDALAEVNPEDPKAIRAIQNDLKCAQRFLSWMGEAVSVGENAQSTFIEQEG